MSIFRSHSLPHILFLGSLAVLVGLAMSRYGALSRAAETVAARQQVVARLRHQLDRFELPYRVLITAAASQQTLNVTPLAALAELDDLRAGAEAIGAGIYVQELQSTLAGLAEVAAAPDSAAARYLDQFFSTLMTLRAQVDREEGRVVGELHSLQARTMRDAWVTLGLLAILAVAYSYVVRRGLSQPITQLARTMREVTDGRLQTRAEIHDDSPVAQLARPFNEMVDILVDSLHEEEQLVSELRQKATDLELANLHKSHFLATVSHELKTPLNAIIGFADLVESGKHGDLTERQREYLQRLLGAGHHLRDLISDLIDIARLDSGSLSLQPADFGPEQICADVIDMLLPQLEAKQQSATLTPAAALPALHADPARYRQLMLNLIGNAIKFTDVGGRITVGFAAQACELVTTVTDTGIGIPEADRERVFEDFVQLDAAANRRHEGTGIGLALCRRLVQSMGGRIWVESQPAGGSAFHFALPLAPAAGAAG